MCDLEIGDKGRSKSLNMTTFDRSHTTYTYMELTTRNSRFGINTAVAPAPIKNFISTIFYLLAL